MKIGIITYIKDDNYGEELQAFALQHFLNTHGYDAEVIDLEKRVKDLSRSKDTILPAIKNRFKVYGWKAPFSIGSKFIEVVKKTYVTLKIKNIEINFTNYFSISLTNILNIRKNIIH